ncbi:MAG: GreA/GreB family elongation factor [Pirellulales bacterium]|nr:GreA/GreB family elongation factor [Pirellulales bacterium]
MTKAKIRKATVGTWVKVIGFDSNGGETFHLVPEAEARPLENMIAVSSPLGEALMDRQVGDRVPFDAPMGRLTLRILELGTEEETEQPKT